MSAIQSVSIDVTKIDKSKLVNGKYLNLDVIINDETNQFGQNVSITLSQSKEEHEQKAPKTYLGNGKVVWNNGTIQNAERKEQVTNSTQNSGRERKAVLNGDMANEFNASQSGDNDLPF